MPSFRKEVLSFYDHAVDLGELDNVSLDWLALFFAVILLAITHPSRYPGQYPSQMMPDTTLLLHPITTSVWYDAVTRCLQESQLQLKSVNALQAIILLDFYEADTKLKVSRLRIAITSAQMMGLHRLGPDTYKDGVELEEREIKKRIWWSLVVKDWNGAAESHGYIVQSNHFSTPLPGN